MPVSSSLGLGSGYLNNPVRDRIRVSDSTTGSYPTILRSTGDTKNLGNSSIFFDDTRTIIFTTSSDVSFPLMLSEVDKNKYLHNWIATPNQSGSITATGQIKPGVSDQGLTFSIKQGLDVSPFDESRIYLDTTPFYLTGTKEEVLAGFSSRLANKIQIKIPLSSDSDKIVSRFNASGLTGETLGVERATAADTGFCYYNNVLKRWEDLGQHDPGTGDSLNYKMWYKSTADTWNPGGIGSSDPSTEGTTLKKYQFVMSQHTGFLAKDYATLLEHGYANIGSPTLAGGAPYDSTYHATSSHTFKMSDYISHPIIVEKAILDVPVIVRRKNGRVNRNDSSKRVDGSIRDIDNYVFFIYRQQRAGSNLAIDSVADCSGSQRFLIMSASAAFYNASVFNAPVRNNIISKNLPHTPNIKKSLALNVSGSDSAEGLEASYTGSLRLELVPESSSGQFLGGSRFPVRSNNTTANPLGTIVVQDFWPGGTTAASKSLSTTSGYTSSPANAAITNKLGRANTLVGYFNNYSPLITAQYPAIDISNGTRSKRNFSGFRSRKKDIITYYDMSSTPEYPIVMGSEKGSTTSPYILFPEDEIIIGVDAGISSTPSSGSSDTYFSSSSPQLYGFSQNDGTNIISGSFMKIVAGEASLTIFGSMVKNDKEHLPSLNQPLTSDAIHEALQSEIYGLDQYDINFRNFYTGSYTDNLIFGNIALTDGNTNVFQENMPDTIVRGVYGSLAKSQKLEDFYYNNITFGLRSDPYGLRSWNVALAASSRVVSYIKGVMLLDFEERFFDTVMPDLSDYAERSGIINTNKLLSGTVPGIFTEKDAQKYAFPYATSVERKLRDDKEMRFEIGPGGSAGPGAAASVGGRHKVLTTNNDEIASYAVLFRKGYRFAEGIDGSTAIDLQYSPHSGTYGKAHGYAYGIQDIRPTYTSAVFRYNSFGQFRDMLEQRKDGKFILTVKTIQKKDSPVQCIFVSQDDGSTEVDPYQTNSSNLSTECTSSIPYIENVASNTGDSDSIPGMVTIKGIGSVEPSTNTRKRS